MAVIDFGATMPDNNPRNLRTVREIARRDILFAVARVPNSARLIVGSSVGKVFEIDATQASPPVVELANHGRYVTAIGLAGQTVISGGYDGKLTWWDMENRRVIRTIDDAHSRPVRMIAVSPDGSKVASVGDDMACRIWNAATGERLHVLRGHEERTPTHFTSMLYCCAFSADGGRLATGDRVGHVVIWDVAEGRQVTSVEAPLLYTWDGVQRNRSIGGVRALAFSPDGTHLAVGGVGQIDNVDGLSGPSRVEVFNLASRQRVHEFTGAQGIINRLVYHPDNSWLCAIGGGGNGIIIFNDPTRRALIHQGNVPMFAHDAIFSEDFTTLYAVGHQKAAVMELRA
jgi:WD40 repeat protein